MAKTAVADVIIPSQFERYAIERTAELSNFGQCGIVEHAPEFDALAAGGGREVKMPFWKDLTATRQLLSDSGTLTVNKITADKDIARIHNDAQAWSVNHLVKVIAGDDPMQAILDLVAAYWARTDGTVYTTYLFGPGAFAKGAAPLQGGIGTEGVEMYRDALASDTGLINRRRYILHPRGVKFTSASDAGQPAGTGERRNAGHAAAVGGRQGGENPNQGEGAWQKRALKWWGLLLHCAEHERV